MSDGCCSCEGGAIATFNYNSWIQLFPEFQSRINPALAQNYFNVATQFIRNDGCGPVCDVQTQTNLLYYTTAHIAQLFGPGANCGCGPTMGRDPGVVGRITNASEGSVSVGTEMSSGNNPNAAWWNQTQYGAMAWLMQAPFRTFRYIRGPFRPVNPWPWPGSWAAAGGAWF